MMFSTWRRVALLATSLVALLAGGCSGGAVGSGGTGAPAQSFGTVSGFGSVIVDGARFDDRDAPTESEDSPGSFSLAEPRLGHRVEIGFQTDGVARNVRIEPELRGRISSIGAGSFVVMGQTVRINTDPLAGPVTQFGTGYSSASDLQQDHLVEVHGVVVRQAGGGYVVQATRVDRRLLAPYLRVAGVVTAVSGGNIQIGALTIATGSASVVPAGGTLAVGQRVAVFARPAALVGATLTAEFVRIKERVNGPVEAYLGGVIGGIDVAGTTFDVDGVTVRAANAVVTPLGATLANGQYVQLRGSFAADGSLTATRVKIRRNDVEPDVQLFGTVLSYSAGAQTFEIRGVTVTAAGAQLQDCTGGLANGLFVEVRGTWNSTGVTAERIRCESSEPAGSVVERRGVASGVDLTGRSFTLTPASGSPVVVDWTLLTYFRDVTPATLAGSTVDVEGAFVGQRLVALRVRLRN